MSIFLEILSAVLAIGVVWWLIRRLLRPAAPAEPVDDPFALVPAPRKRGPKGRSGAVALEEPEEETDATFPPIRL
jgi:hypothetical protein